MIKSILQSQKLLSHNENHTCLISEILASNSRKMPSYQQQQLLIDFVNH